MELTAEAFEQWVASQILADGDDLKRIVVEAMESWRKSRAG